MECKKVLKLVMACLLIASCNGDSVSPKSGEIIIVPFVKNIFIGTDSTIVITDRHTGVVIEVIRRDGSK